MALSEFDLRIRGAVLLVAAAVTATAAAREFRAMWPADPIGDGPGVTRKTMLSSYDGQLAGTAGDTPIYDPRGPGPGGTVLVLGGTHADEPAGYLAAVVLVEQARVEAGRLIVIPRANASGFTHNYPAGRPPAVASRSPRRRACDGSRTARAPRTRCTSGRTRRSTRCRGSGQTLSGSETRNLNRAYPGRADGTLTEQIAFAITTLIRRERVDLALDLHEASPEYPVVNTMVAHQRADRPGRARQHEHAGAPASPSASRTSPANLHGLSHREWGDATPALAVLMETTNPAQGRLRGRTDADLVVERPRPVLRARVGARAACRCRSRKRAGRSRRASPGTWPASPRSSPRWARCTPDRAVVLPACPTISPSS